MSKQPKSGIIWRGSSPIDGQEIVVIGTYSDKNTKTGKVLQTYVLLADVNPLDASKLGLDRAICGNCKHRGTPNNDPKRKIAKGRTCYVNLGQGVLMVWRAYRRGVYDKVDPIELGRDRFIRIGTYGDPAMIPSKVWDDLTSECDSWTAYTHQLGWNPHIAMQSADSLEEAERQWKLGRRTFRVMKDQSEIVKGKEVLCPASKEAGRRVQCNACKLCKGFLKAKSVAIVEH